MLRASEGVSALLSAAVGALAQCYVVGGKILGHLLDSMPRQYIPFRLELCVENAQAVEALAGGLARPLATKRVAATAKGLRVIIMKMLMVAHSITAGDMP